MNKMIHGDCLNVLPEIQEQSVNCCVTSPPYWGLRDYGADGQLGLEATPDKFPKWWHSLLRCGGCFGMMVRCG